MAVTPNSFIAPQTPNSGGAAVTAATSGSGTAHNTMPPYLVLNYIIKY